MAEGLERAVEVAGAGRIEQKNHEPEPCEHAGVESRWLIRQMAHEGPVRRQP